MTVYVSYYK